MGQRKWLGMSHISSSPVWGRLGGGKNAEFHYDISIVATLMDLV